MSVEQWEDVIKVNLNSVFYMTKQIIKPMMKARSGSIINMSSVIGEMGNAGQTSYAASKAGVLGMTKTIAKELANNAVTCNALALGYFDQGMISEVSEEMQQQIISQIPKNRLGGVETVLAAIDWLLKNESDYVTGQTISLNGGLFT